MKSVAHSAALLIVVLLAAVLLSGCAKSESERLEETWYGQPGGALPGDPGIELVGIWRVSDAAEAEADTWIRFGEDLALYRPCGWSFGDWRTSVRAFLADLTAQSSGCGDATRPVWLLEARGFRGSMFGDVTLLDADGGPLAHLVYDGAPPSTPAVDDDYRKPPALDAGVQANVLWLPPAVLDREPLTAATLLGRWVPSGADSSAAETPYAEFRADGTYVGVNGPSAIGGRWSFPEGRPFLAMRDPRIPGGRTDERSDIESWLLGACAIDLDHGVLVLLDQQGTELGRLIRA